jgi:hypothetical protein
MILLANSTKHLKKDYFQSFQNIDKEEKLPNSFYEARFYSDNKSRVGHKK